MVAVRMAMDLIIMETILEVAEAITILAITTPIFKFWTHERMKLLEGEVLAHMVLKANTLPKHKSKVTLVVPAAAVAMAVAEGFNYCQATKLSRRGEPEK